MGTNVGRALAASLGYHDTARVLVCGDLFDKEGEYQRGQGLGEYINTSRLGVGAGLARHLSPERGHRQRLQEKACKRAFSMHSNMELCLLFWSRTAWGDGTTVSWGAPHTRAKLFERRVENNLSVPCSRWVPGEFLVVLVLGCNLLATVCFEIPLGVELLDVVGQVLLIGATGKERFGFNSAAVDSS